MGHAETATTSDLVDRIARWVTATLSAPIVCDDGARD
jgi:hypothetical protein